MATQSLEALRAKALEILSRRTRERLTLVSVSEGITGSTRKRILHFAATVGTRQNDAPALLALDEQGETVEVGEIRAREALVFKPVVPAFVPFDPAVVEPHLIKIDPKRNDLTLGECDKFSETITVTIPALAAVSKADVYFLSDTTGSMETILSAVQTGASSIHAALAALGLDITYGVGNYKDFQTPQLDPYAFQHQLNPNIPGQTLADVQTAINNWSASGGNDTAEGAFFALDQLAQAPGGSIGWRPGSKRIIVWIGDAPAHDPVCKAISGLGFDITEGTAAAPNTVIFKLLNSPPSERIVVVAISTGTGPGLDADPVAFSADYNAACGAPGGTVGQATRITAATGGQHIVGINAATVVQTIVDLVKSAIATIGNVKLVPTAAIAPYVTSISPAGGFGPLDGDKDQVLKFDVSFAGGVVPCAIKAQVISGALNVVVDGTVVAAKPTRITVPACRYTYSVKFVCGVQEACDCACTSVVPGVYATEINIHNPKCHDAAIEKRFIPLVLAGAAIGREPKIVSARAQEKIRLPAHSATMDDCCHIREVLLGAPPVGSTPITIGFLEILSDVELAVSAVYTVSDLKGNGVNMNVVNYTPHLE